MSKTFVRPDYDKTDYLLVLDDPNHTDASISRVTQAMSGSPGSDSVVVKVGMNVTLPNPKNYYAITGLGIEENWDKPCKLKLYGTLVDPRYQGETRIVAKHELKKCKPSPGIAYKDVDFSEDRQYFDFRKEGKKFMRAVRVCGGSGKVFPPQMAYNSTAWKIKGIHAFPSEVKLADSLALKAEIEQLDELEKFVRANCPEYFEASEGSGDPGWSPKWTQCPTNQVATGVRAYHYKNKYYTGLELICQNVVSRRISKYPVKEGKLY